MEWTKPLSAALAVLIALLAVGSAVQLGQTTFTTGPDVIESIATIVFVGVVVVAAIAVGARGGQWLDNPGYW
ncbi:uncharacterized protein NP_3088A [Natronomonas pharaonis DSM 2160]|uniref:Uncharacterized protein n=1 Tax=Natronomonas pharaonis (strain ATCC 35678 / DSM 2160 / CIP 103997 / JCM 8858 / NBRC 14720 / NCIMB 2260 / Gabara) TaxID=348780 RepID=A0A1U7EWZ5_NATPD|nr:hypothetical protein [Natronomonas pharaonis]CAI49635.1 uncharacterized protein NP_3088A [Natronomonas pharaonis DSM 2160]